MKQTEQEAQTIQAITNLFNAAIAVLNDPFHTDLKYPTVIGLQKAVKEFTNLAVEAQSAPGKSKWQGRLDEMQRIQKERAENAKR